MEPIDVTGELAKTMTTFSLGMSIQTLAELRPIAEQREVTVSEVVRRAIALLLFVEAEAAKDNRLVSIGIGPDGKRTHREIVVAANTSASCVDYRVWTTERPLWSRTRSGG